VVVNASGPWSDEVRALAGEPKILKPTKGVHLVVDAARMPLKHAVVMLARKDHRVMFAIPWGQRAVIGTTDTFFDGTPEGVHATAEDVDYILETANHYFPESKLEPKDVTATWAGLRPLVAPNSEGLGASDVSREHHLLENPGFITIAGGKLTTYRRIAAEVVDAVSRQIPGFPPCSTAERSLPGSEGIAGVEELALLRDQLAKKGAPEPLAQHLVDAFGIRSLEVLARALHTPDGLKRLDPELPCVMAEVDEAMEHEMALTLSDVIGRRVPLLLKAKDQGLGIAPEVAERMAQRLGWSPERTQGELERYRRLVHDSRQWQTR
jgi:glycerol-3-phosphate dehydrogenase